MIFAIIFIAIGAAIYSEPAPPKHTTKEIVEHVKQFGPGSFPAGKR